MPMLFLLTNIPEDKLPKDANVGLTNLISKELNKPKDYIFVSIQHVPNLSFKGTLDPAALVDLKSIGFVSKSKVVAAVTKHLNDNFGIPSDRVGMTLCDLEGSNVGIGGRTFG